MRSEEQKEAWDFLKQVYHLSPKSRLRKIRQKQLCDLEPERLSEFVNELEDLAPLIKSFQSVWQEMSEERWEFYERAGSTHLREYQIMQERAKAIRSAFGEIASAFFSESDEDSGEESGDS